MNKFICQSVKLKILFQFGFIFIKFLFNLLLIIKKRTNQNNRNIIDCTIITVPMACAFEYIIAKPMQVTGIVKSKIIVITPEINSPALPPNPKHITATVPDPTYTRVIKNDFFKAIKKVLFITHL